VVSQQLRIGAAPEHVGDFNFVGHQGIAAPASTPADDVMDCVVICARSFDRDTGMDAEGTAPPYDAGAIDLYYRTALDCGIGGLSGALLARQMLGGIQI
jgi:hypothetical protein